MHYVVWLKMKTVALARVVSSRNFIGYQFPRCFFFGCCCGCWTPQMQTFTFKVSRHLKPAHVWQWRSLQRFCWGTRGGCWDFGFGAGVQHQIKLENDKQVREEDQEADPQEAGCTPASLGLSTARGSGSRHWPSWGTSLSSRRAAQAAVQLQILDLRDFRGIVRRGWSANVNNHQGWSPS